MLKEATIVAVTSTAITNLIVVPMDLIIVGRPMPETYVSYVIGLLSLIALCWLVADVVIEKTREKAYKDGYIRGYKDSSHESYWKHEGKAEAVVSRILK